MDDRARSHHRARGLVAGTEFADASLLQQIEAEVASEMEAAVQSALAAPYPSLDQVEKDIYA